MSLFILLFKKYLIILNHSPLLATFFAPNSPTPHTLKLFNHSLCTKLSKCRRNYLMNEGRKTWATQCRPGPDPSFGGCHGRESNYNIFSVLNIFNLNFHNFFQILILYPLNFCCPKYSLNVFQARASFFGSPNFMKHP